MSAPALLTVKPTVCRRSICGIKAVNIGEAENGLLVIDLQIVVQFAMHS